VSVEEVPLGVSSGEVVVGAGEESAFISFSGAVEGVDELEGVGGVDIVVDEAVHDEEVSFKLIDIVEDGSQLIAAGILLGGAHVAFGPDGIVVAPIGGSGAVNGGVEDVRVLEQGHGGEVAAVGVADDADAASIDIWSAAEEFDTVSEIFGVDDSEVEISSGCEGFAAIGSAPIVDGGDDEAVFGVGIDRLIEVMDPLRTRATIDVKYHRVFFLGIEVGRKVENAVEIGGLIIGFISEKFG